MSQSDSLARELALAASRKFSHPDITAKGERRASVRLDRLETLWVNTGSLCNIECANCYIESSPTNDRLAYMTLAETVAFLDEIAALNLGTSEIGFTGGEPFMNPDIIAMTDAALARGFRVLLLTNAMLPMQRPRVKAGLLGLKAAHGARLTIRMNLDHHTQALHETERGACNTREHTEQSCFLSCGRRLGRLAAEHELADREPDSRQREQRFW